MTEGEYTPDRASAEPNAAPVMMFTATGLTSIIISVRRINPSLLDIFLNGAKYAFGYGQDLRRISEIIGKIKAKDRNPTK
jgi:hypothetical protein